MILISGNIYMSEGAFNQKFQELFLTSSFCFFLYLTLTLKLLITLPRINSGEKATVRFSQHGVGILKFFKDKHFKNKNIIFKVTTLGNTLSVLQSTQTQRNQPGTQTQTRDTEAQ